MKITGVIKNSDELDRLMEDASIKYSQFLEAVEKVEAFELEFDFTKKATDKLSASDIKMAWLNAKNKAPH